MPISTKLLNQTKKNAAKTNKRQRIKTDTKGLYCVCQPTGSVSWVLAYRFNGKQVSFSFPANNEAEAMIKATGYKADIKNGINPKEVNDAVIKESKDVKERGIIAKSGTFTVNDVIELYHSTVMSVEWRDNTINTTVGQLNKHVKPLLGDRNFDDITYNEWRDHVMDIKNGKHTGRKAPTVARNVLKVMQAASKVARFHDKTSNVDILAIPVKMIAKQGKASDRVLSESERGDVWAWCNDGESYQQRLTRLLISFGARTHEIRISKVSEWDIDGKIWTCPPENSKSKETIVRPIPDHVMPTVKKLIEEAEIRGSEYLMGKEIKSTVVSRDGCQIHKKMNHTPWSLHDIRRTFISGSGEIGQDPSIIELLAGHKLSSVRGAYQKSTLTAQKLDVLNAWASHLNLMASNKLCA